MRARQFESASGPPTSLLFLLPTRGPTNPFTLALPAAIAVCLLPLVFARSEYATLWNLPAAAALLAAAALAPLKPGIGAQLWTVIRKSPFFLFYCGYLVFSDALSRLFEPELGLLGFEHALVYAGMGFVSFFIIPFGICQVRSSGLLAMLAVVGVLASGVAVLVGLTGSRTFLGVTIEVVRPAYGDLVHFNSSLFGKVGRLGFVAYMGALTSLYLAVKGRWRWAAWVSVAICCGGVFLSGTRAMYGALFLTPFVWLFFSTNRRHRVFLAFAAVAIGGGLAYFLTQDWFYAVTIGPGLAKREIYWPAAVSSILEKPWLGWGFGRSDIIQQTLFLTTGYENVIHSTALSLAFRGGLPLALCYLSTFWFSAVRLIRSNWQVLEKAYLASAVMSAFLAALVLDYTPGGVSYTTAVQTIFLGLANASYWIAHPWLPQADWLRFRLQDPADRA